MCLVRVDASKQKAYSLSSPVDKYAKVPFRSKQVTVPTRLCYHASMITFVPANYEVTFFYNVDRISTVLVFLTRTMPDWCGHAWPTGPGQNESQEGPEPVHLSKNTRTVERLLKPTRTVERFATSRPLASFGRSIIPRFRPGPRRSYRDLARHAMPVHPARPLLRRAVPVLTVVTTDADADADARRGHAGYGTYSPPTGPHVCTRDGIIGSSASPRFVVAGYISYPLFGQQARCRRPGRRVRVVLLLLVERVNGHSTPSTLARSAPRPRRRSEKR